MLVAMPNGQAQLHQTAPGTASDASSDLTRLLPSPPASAVRPPLSARILPAGGVRAIVLPPRRQAAMATGRGPLAGRIPSYKSGIGRQWLWLQQLAVGWRALPPSCRIRCRILGWVVLPRLLLSLRCLGSLTISVCSTTILRFHPSLLRPLYATELPGIVRPQRDAEGLPRYP